METIKVGIIQYDVQWENKIGNFEKIESLLATNYHHQDLIILPEMFSTGFSMSPRQLAEELDGLTMQKLLEWAVKYDCCFSGSFICKVDKGYANKFVAVYPDGSYVDYDKKYLFSPAGESDVYQAGDKLSFFTINGWNICPLICYDLRFPEWPRSEDHTPDLIIYTASWPLTRIGHWDKLLAARAIENQCFTVGVNRIGSDGNGFAYNGHSVFKNYNGDSIRSCGEDEGFFSHELKPDHVVFKEKLNFLSDKQAFRFPSNK